MPAKTGLRLLAQDEADLAVIAAATQDAVLKVGDLAFDRRARTFTVALNRFRWEAAAGRGPYRRVRAGLSFNAVLGVQSHKLRLDAEDAIAQLLTVRFEAAAEPPAGVVRLIMAGGGEIRLDVECIDAALLDLTAEWTTSSKPQHGRE
jgi:hypothetical protein